MWAFIFDSQVEAELFLKLFKEAYPDIYAEFDDLIFRSVAVRIDLFPSYERVFMPRKLAKAFVAVCRKAGENLYYRLIPSKNQCLISFDQGV